MAVFFFASPTRQAYACCWACAESDCNAATDHIDEAHDQIYDTVEEAFNEDLLAFENWLLDNFLPNQIIPAMRQMTLQMAATSFHSLQSIGAFFDAQAQIETQNLLRKLRFQAHKDYRPSQDFCYFGTNVSSLAASDSRNRFNSFALSQISLNRQLGTLGSIGQDNVIEEYESRWNHFVKTYCNIRDNNFQTGGTVTAPDFSTGLSLACDHDGPGGDTDRGAESHDRINRDIDYTRLVETKRTIDVDFTNDTLDSEYLSIFGNLLPNTVNNLMQPGDEEDVIALSRNLYSHTIPSRKISWSTLNSSTSQKLFLSLRSIIAKRSVAQTTFNAIVGLKSSGTSHEEEINGVSNLLHPTGAVYIPHLHQSRRYMLAIMEQLMPASPKISAGNLFEIIGYSPSYYAQLEILAKRIYQNPDFFANLYDTPANVARKRVAMQAIDLMLDREIYESQLRREMSVSVLLSSKLRPAYRNANVGLSVGEKN